jgi:hypothetical protein
VKGGDNTLEEEEEEELHHFSFQTLSPHKPHALSPSPSPELAPPHANASIFSVTFFNVGFALTV